jgi:hypothetical protein
MVTVVVTSPGGMSSTSSVSLVKSTLPLTIDVGENALNQFNQDLSGLVSGEISGPGYSISVNGVSANTSYDSGTQKTFWYATIPGNEEGWMEIIATATPSSGAPITARYEFEKPPLLRLKEHHFELPSPCPAPGAHLNLITKNDITSARKAAPTTARAGTGWDALPNGTGRLPAS